MVSEIFQEFVSGTRERESEEYLRTLSGEKLLGYQYLKLTLYAEQA